MHTSPRFSSSSPRRTCSGSTPSPRGLSRMRCSHSGSPASSPGSPRATTRRRSPRSPSRVPRDRRPCRSDSSPRPWCSCGRAGPGAPPPSPWCRLRSTASSTQSRRRSRSRCRVPGRSRCSPTRARAGRGEARPARHSAAPAGAGTPRRRLAAARRPREAVVPIALAAAVVVQPLLLSPSWLVQNEQRLASLSLPALAAAALATLRRVDLTALRCAALPAILAASFHHLTAMGRNAGRIRRPRCRRVRRDRSRDRYQRPRSFASSSARRRDSATLRSVSRAAASSFDAALSAHRHLRLFVRREGRVTQPRRPTRLDNASRRVPYYASLDSGGALREPSKPQ